VDPNNTVGFVQDEGSGLSANFLGSEFGSAGDPVGYTVFLLTTDITNEGEFFVYEDGVTPKEGVIEIQASGDLTIQTVDGSSFGNLRLQPSTSSPELVSFISDVEFGSLEYWNGTVCCGSHNMNGGVLEFFG